MNNEIEELKQVEVILNKLFEKYSKDNPELLKEGLNQLEKKVRTELLREVQELIYKRMLESYDFEKHLKRLREEFSKVEWRYNYDAFWGNVTYEGFLDVLNIEIREELNSNTWWVEISFNIAGKVYEASDLGGYNDLNECIAVIKSHLCAIQKTLSHLNLENNV